MSKIFCIAALLAFSPLTAKAADAIFKISVMSLYHPNEASVFYDGEEPLVLMIDGVPQYEYFAARGEHFSIKTGTVNITAPSESISGNMVNATRRELVISVFGANGNVIKRRYAYRLSYVSFFTQDTKKLSNKYTVKLSDDVSKTYEGVLELRLLNRELLILLSVPRELIVASVTGSEMGIYSSKEALKAQAVISRTFLYASKGRHFSADHDFCDTTHCQFYKEQSFAVSEASEAARATSDEVMTYSGEIAQPYYFSTCGGYTAKISSVWGDNDESYPYIKPVKCDFCSSSKFHRYRRTIARNTLSRLFTGKDDPSFDIIITKKDSNGHWVENVKIIGTGQEYDIMGERFKGIIGEALGWNQLPSSAFDIRRLEDAFEFSGKGMGHGVGMCQTGADNMAKRGFDYRQIIEFYFPGAVLSKTRE